jgi:hypothetical protein
MLKETKEENFNAFLQIDEDRIRFFEKAIKEGNYVGIDKEDFTKSKF